MLSTVQCCEVSSLAVICYQFVSLCLDQLLLYRVAELLIDILVGFVARGEDVCPEHCAEETFI